MSVFACYTTFLIFHISLQISFPCLLILTRQRKPGAKMPIPPAYQFSLLSQFWPPPQLIRAPILILREILVGPGWEEYHPLVQLAWLEKLGHVRDQALLTHSSGAGAMESSREGDDWACAVPTILCWKFMPLLPTAPKDPPPLHAHNFENPMCDLKICSHILKSHKVTS